MRSISNTQLSLGVLNAPIKIYPAASNRQDVKFKLCGPKGEPVEQVYRIVGTDKIVGTSSDCERQVDDFLINKDSLAQIESESYIDNDVNLKEAMNIQKFIPLKGVPFERATGRYYIGPGNGSSVGFATIVKAMEKKRLAAVAKFVLKGRQSCFVLFVRDGILNAIKLTFSADIEEPTHEVSEYNAAPKQHVDMAVQLIEAYVDQDAQVLDEMEDTLIPKKQALVEQARSGKAIEPTTIAPPTTSAPDLMDQLQAELERVKGERVAA